MFIFLLFLSIVLAQEQESPLEAQQAKLDNAEAKLQEKKSLAEELSTTTDAANDVQSSTPINSPIETPSPDEISTFLKSTSSKPKWDSLNAPHNLLSWKYPVDYLIDPDPKRVDGDLIPENKRRQAVPTSGSDALQAGPIGANNPGITVSVWNPGWPLSAQQLRMIGVAINQVGGDHPELPMNADTRCFCRVIAPVPRCACQNGKTPQDVILPSKAEAMNGMLRDIEEQAVRAVAKVTKYRPVQYRPRPSIFTKRIVEHRKATGNLRAKRVAGEWKDTIHDLAHELSHPSIEDPSLVLANIQIGDVACIDSHWCVRENDNDNKKDEDDEKNRNKKWVASTKAETIRKKNNNTAGWCVGVGRIVSVTKEGTACVHYESVHNTYVGDANDYHLPTRIPGSTGSNTHSSTSKIEKVEKLRSQCFDTTFTIIVVIIVVVIFFT